MLQNIRQSVRERTEKDNHERKVQLSRNHAHRIRGESFYYDYPQNAFQLERVFRLRYQVFCEECGFIPKELFPDGKERDMYDYIQSTRMFVALDPDKQNDVLGVIRAVRDPQNTAYNPYPLFDQGDLIEELPIEKYVSLSPFRDKGRNIEQVTNLTVGHGKGKKIHFGLFKSICLDALDHNIDDIFIQANPKAAWMFEAIGFERMYEGRYSIIECSVAHNKEVPVCGMHLDMHNINETFLRYFNQPSNSFLFRERKYLIV